MPHFSKASAPKTEEAGRLSPETGKMLDVIIALIPSAFAGIAVFGFRAALVIALTVGSAVLFEHLYCVIRKSPTTVGDLSAVVTGLILAFSLPVKVPLYACVFGSAIAIITVKLLAGGKGKNFLNPAIMGRAALFIAFTPSLVKYTVPSRNPVDAVSCATPLKVLSELDFSADMGEQISRLTEQGELPGLINMFFGVKAGCIGEVCAVALLLGGLYLILRGVISFVLPLTFLGSLALVTFICTGFSPILTLYYLLSGAVLLSAFFIITDPVTAPDTLKKKLIFGTVSGALVAVIRLFTPFAEGVMVTVLFMELSFYTVKMLPVIKAKIAALKQKKIEETTTEATPAAASEADTPTEETTEETTPEVDITTESTPEAESVTAGDDNHETPSDSTPTTEDTTPEADTATEETTEDTASEADTTTEETTTDSAPEAESVTAGDDDHETPSDTTPPTEDTVSEAETTTEDTPETDSETVGDDDRENPSDSTPLTEDTVSEADNPTEETTEDTASEADITTESAPETDSETVGDDDHENPSDSTPTTEDTTPEADTPTEETTTESTPETDSETVGDDDHGVPSDSTPPTAEKTARPVFINELTHDPDFVQPERRRPEKKKKQGRKAKKKEKIMPDFSEPLPEVIPEFLKKEIEINKNRQGK